MENKKTKNGNNLLRKLFFKIYKDERGSTLIEYGLIVGFAIVSFIVIVGIITSILEWSTSALADFFNSFHL